MKKTLSFLKRYYLIGMILVLTSSCQEYINYPPEITNLTVVWNTNEIKSGESISIICFASDPEGDEINYNWVCSDGNFEENGLRTVTYNTPPVKDRERITITVFVGDVANPNADSESIELTIVSSEEVITINAIEDSYVSYGHPDDNKGSSEYLFTGRLEPDPDKGFEAFEAFIKFPITDALDKSRIDQIHLKLYVADHTLNRTGGKIGNYYVYYVPSNLWGERTITFNNKPNHENLIGILENIDGYPKEITIDLTDNFFDYYTIGDYNIKIMSGNDDWFFGILNSKESGNPPKLVIHTR